VKPLGHWALVGTALTINIGNNGGKWSTSRCGRFAAGERIPTADSIEGWIVSRAGLDALGGKISGPRRGIESRFLMYPARRPATIPTKSSRLRAGLWCDQAVGPQWAPKFWWGVRGKGGTNYFAGLPIKLLSVSDMHFISPFLVLLIVIRIILIDASVF
jgi:hypothetical protein